MDMRLLKTFIMAAEYENFRIVSEKLYITQPAVTFQIRQLEKEIGNKLFLKHGRQIQLTEIGRLFYKEALKLVNQYETSMTLIGNYQQGFTKSIRIAISPLLADTVLPAIFREYTKRNSNVVLSIQVIESNDINDAVENDEADIGLSCLPGSSNINTVKFHEESISLVCSHDGYDLESGPVLEARKLLENNVIFTDNHPVYWRALKEQLKATLHTFKFIKITQSHIAKRFVLEGIGISFLPKSIINRELLEGRLLEVPVPILELPKACMYILYKYDHEKESDFVRFVSNFHLG
ncbi:LysR family transcriptional regulator [Virgibacillus ihumii]|uniref:LysR family transcriptional regulator n=1 Tax=Virgibacillus ihumii TaxID=2686091 RepID=UPI00157C2E0B|nr:LysR family transcriptional regulator [Virgibacillus ihumii]